MNLRTPHLHHVTAIAGDPQRNAEFYVTTLGLRLLKRTVNHDDTGTYHFYFGDGEGTPGTAITFFPYGERGRAGEVGAGQTTAVAFAVRPDSIDYWIDRLTDAGVDVSRTERFDETVLSFADPDGIGLELVAPADDPPAVTPWESSPVPPAHQIRGFYGVTLALADVDPTAGVLTDVYGLELDGEADGRRRYRTAGDRASVVDLVETDRGRGRMGVGTVHHVAFAAADTDEQERVRERLADRGLRVTEVIDRTYFDAIYSREPGGVLIETATMGPGFDADEDVSELGSRLTLPDWLEPRRESIEARLPPFDPSAVAGREVASDD